MPAETETSAANAGVIKLAEANAAAIRNRFMLIPLLLICLIALDYLALNYLQSLLFNSIVSTVFQPDKGITPHYTALSFCLQGYLISSP